MINKQQLLQFSSPLAHDYRMWVHHAGTATASAKVAMWLQHGGFLWLNSSSAAGKSHLLHALAQEYSEFCRVEASKKRLEPVQQVAVWLNTLQCYQHWAVDLYPNQVSEQTALALFHLIERAKEAKRPLLIAWRCKDDDLQPDELASRMRMMEQVMLEAPESDADLGRVLKATAKQLSWDIPDGVIKVMLQHLPRDLNTQIEALHRLEAASLEERARLTQVWAKKKLNI